MRKQILMRTPHVLALLAVLVTAGTAKAQETVIKEVGRAHLAPSQNADAVGLVRWSLVSKGTRKSNVVCSIEKEFTNSTSELLFRLTDSGGLSGDPACELTLMFLSLKNSYRFEEVTISKEYCGNPECKTKVVATVPKGSTSLEVVVRGDMKGVLSLFPARKAIFRVRTKLRGPAGESPFVD